MSRDQRSTAEEKAYRREIVEAFKESPVELPAFIVEDLLCSLCSDLGYCLTPDAYESIMDNPPTDPDSFVRLVLELEDGGSSDEEIYNLLFGQVYKTFLGVQRSKT